MQSEKLTAANESDIEVAIGLSLCFKKLLQVQCQEKMGRVGLVSSWG